MLQVDTAQLRMCLKRPSVELLSKHTPLQDIRGRMEVRANLKKIVKILVINMKFSFQSARRVTERRLWKGLARKKKTLGALSCHLFSLLQQIFSLTC